MSQHARRILAALGLATALLLAAPPPSRAAGLQGFPVVPGFAARAWAWLEALFPDRPAPRAGKQGIASQTADTLTSPTVPAATGTSEEGSAIDPNGRK